MDSKKPPITVTPALIHHFRDLSDSISYAPSMIPQASLESDKLFSNMSPEALKISHALSQNHEPQVSGAFCGIASAVIALKYLFSDNPAMLSKLTQEKLHDDYVKGKFWKTKEDVRYGLSLPQIGSLVAAAGGKEVEVKMVQIPNVDALEESFKGDLESAFGAGPEPKVIIINFYRDYKEHRGGHFCPIGGYSRMNGTDYAFILDVAAHRAKPHWFPVKQLVPLMCRFDGKMPRGYLIVSKVISHIR